MDTQVKLASARASAVVELEPKSAFDHFTAGMVRWWNRSYTINKSPIAAIVIEPRAGGRWFERGEDGSEVIWGKVLAWEPPGRLVLAWQINADWQYDPKLVTKIEVRLVAEGNGTRVGLEHRNFEQLGEKG